MILINHFKFSINYLPEVQCFRCHLWNQEFQDCQKVQVNHQLREDQANRVFLWGRQFQVGLIHLAVQVDQ